MQPEKLFGDRVKSALLLEGLNAKEGQLRIKLSRKFNNRYVMTKNLLTYYPSNTITLTALKSGYLLLPRLNPGIT